ncbi:MAG: ABC-2 family transporter protein [Deltaproteobacteria bacterium]|nr:ABC-2 family transporter protein [Deltaproteobacteria bacterium]
MITSGLIRLEIMRSFAYPKSYLIRNMLPALIKISAVWILWQAIIESAPSGIGSLSSEYLRAYSVIAPSLYLLLRPEQAFLMSEIYSGTITRYFVYPKNFVWTQLARQIGFSLTRLPEILLIGVFVFFSFDLNLNLASLFFFAVFCLLSFILTFLMFMCAELISMLIEEGWTFSHILDRLIFGFGGLVIPITLFPSPVQDLLSLTPFPFVCFVPAQMILNDAINGMLIKHFLVGLLYVFLLSFLASYLYKIGRERYTAYGS